MIQCQSFCGLLTCYSNHRQLLPLGAVLTDILGHITVSVLPGVR